MSPAREAAASALLRRRIGFVRRLLDGGTATRQGATFRIDDPARPFSLGEQDVAELAAMGVLTVAEGDCRAGSGARSWVRRNLIEEAPFAGQHQLRVVDPAGPIRDLEASPLLRLARALPGEGQAFLSPAEVEAGERIRRLWERSQLRPRLTRSYDPMAIRGGSPLAGREIGEQAAEARARLNRLLAQLPRDCADVVVDICGDLKGLQQIESERGWPRRSAKLVLRIGLQQLAGLMGLADQAAGPDRASIRGRMEGERLPL